MRIMIVDPLESKVELIRRCKDCRNRIEADLIESNIDLYSFLSKYYKINRHYIKSALIGFNANSFSENTLYGTIKYFDNLFGKAA